MEDWYRVIWTDEATFENWIHKAVTLHGIMVPKWHPNILSPYLRVGDSLLAFGVPLLWVKRGRSTFYRRTGE